MSNRIMWQCVLTNPPKLDTDVLVKLDDNLVQCRLMKPAENVDGYEEDFGVWVDTLQYAYIEMDCGASWVYVTDVIKAFN